nr:hypothetical protein [Tanacetum cinerariifolium]
MPWMVDGMALSCFMPGRPKMMLYGEGAGMIVNFIIASDTAYFSKAHTPLPKHPPRGLVPKPVETLLGHSSTFHLSSWFFSSCHTNDTAPYLSPCLSVDRCFADLLFLFALRHLPDGLACQTVKLFLTHSLNGNSHLHCGIFHCDSRNICLDFLCWVPPPTALAVAGTVGVLWLRSPAGYLSMSSGLRLPCFLLADEIPNWGIVAVSTVGVDRSIAPLYRCFFSLDFILGQFRITERLFRPQIIIHLLQHLINRLRSMGLMRSRLLGSFSSSFRADAYPLMMLLVVFCKPVEKTTHASLIPGVIPGPSSNIDIAVRHVVVNLRGRQDPSIPAREVRYSLGLRPLGQLTCDENTKFFHGILNSKSFQLAIRGTLVDGEWIVVPLSLEQQADLERNVSNEEIKSAV